MSVIDNFFNEVTGAVGKGIDLLDQALQLKLIREANAAEAAQTAANNPTKPVSSSTVLLYVGLGVVAIGGIVLLTRR